MSNGPNRDSRVSGSDVNRSEARTGASVRSIETVGSESVGELVIIPEEAPVSFSGHLPPPPLLAAYEGVGEGFAGRILRQAEAVSDHRRSLESVVVSADLRLQERGQWFAFVAAMTALVGGIGLIAVGKPISGMSTAIIAVGIWVGMFAWTTRRHGRDATGGSAAAREKVPGEVHRLDKKPIPLPRPDDGGSGRDS